MNGLLGLLLLCALQFPAWASAEELLVGYVMYGRFHPVVYVREGRFAQPELDGSIPNVIYPAFEPGCGEELETRESKEYVDRYGVDERGKFAPVFGGDMCAFFYSGLPDLPFTADNEVAKDFLEFFSNDSWGHHFFSPELPELPEPTGSSLAEIVAATGIRPRAVTDLDTDGHMELWSTYRLMYGETGAMVYERLDRGSWKSVTNQCFKCD